MTKISALADTLLDGVDSEPSAPDLVVVGAGLAARGLAEAVVRQRILTDLVVTDPGRIDLTVYPRHGIASTAGAALAHHLRHLETASAVRVRSVKHWTDLDSVRPRLTVVATSTVEPDRAITELLTRRDLPHLVLRLDPDSVRVGPLVVPGRTPCLNCVDTLLAEADAGWPQTLLEMSGSTVAAAPPILTEWAAAVSAVQARSYLLSGTADALGCTLELSWHEPITRVRRWRRHPDCGCAWWTG